MSVTQEGTSSIGVDSDTLNDTLTYSHTVPSGTDLLLVTVANNANEVLSAAPTWDSTSLTLIKQSTDSGASDNVELNLYGLLSPTPATGNTVVDFLSDTACMWSASVNYAGVDTASLAAAITFLSEDVDDAASGTTSVHASAGSSGNGLFQFGSCIGADSTPASNSDGFSEIHDTDTGGGENNNQDHGCYVSELLSGLPSGITVTWGATDEKASMFFELNAATASSMMAKMMQEGQMNV